MTVLQVVAPAAVSRAGLWFLQSGIQSAGGGVARYYRADVERNTPCSTEITGYAASAYSYLFEKTGEPVYHERALETARFLTHCAWKRDLAAFPFEIGAEPAGLAPAYFFDTGIIVRGLLSVWRMSGEGELLDLAALAARSMWRDFDSGGDYHPVLELPSKTPAKREAKWSRAPGCYQLKAALGWHELARVTGEAEYRSRFEALQRWALNDQRDFLPGDADEHKVMDRLHAYCYCLEAFLADGVDVADGVARVARYLREIGPRFARSDVYAQLLRIRLMSGVGLDEAEGEARELEKFQAVDGDPRIDGGFYFGVKDGVFLPHVNPVSTAFAMQALQMWHERLAGLPAPDYRTLI